MRKTLIILFFTGLVNIAYSQDSLRFWADKLDFNIGSAVEGFWFNNDYYNQTNRTYNKILTGQFNMIVAGNEMKYDYTEPKKGQFNFTGGDVLVNFAQEHDMAVRGHCLLWHAQLPGWINAGLTNGQNNGLYTRDSLLRILENHITTLVTRYKGKIREWDVVNEVFNGDGSLRQTIWQQVIGNDYIDSAFVYAYRADTAALLFLNDFGSEGINSKSTAIYNKAKELVVKGIPIHGIGMQGHVTCNDLNFVSIEKNIQRIVELGLLANLTEVDVKISASDFGSESVLNIQAVDYSTLLSIMLKYKNCTSLVVWGFSDANSWIPGQTSNQYGQACLYNSKYQPKPAYYAMLDTLKAANGVYSGTEVFQKATISVYPNVLDNVLVIKTSGNESRPLKATVFNIMGQPVMSFILRSDVTTLNVENLQRGMYVLKLADNDNVINSIKLMKN
jgi:endo-1,4-beta-xylanase